MYGVRCTVYGVRHLSRSTALSDSSARSPLDAAAAVAAVRRGMFTDLVFVIGKYICTDVDVHSGKKRRGKSNNAPMVALMQYN